MGQGAVYTRTADGEPLRAVDPGERVPAHGLAGTSRTTPPSRASSRRRSTRSGPAWCSTRTRSRPSRSRASRTRTRTALTCASGRTRSTRRGRWWRGSRQPWGTRDSGWPSTGRSRARWCRCAGTARIGGSPRSCSRCGAGPTWMSARVEPLAGFEDVAGRLRRRSGAPGGGDRGLTPLRRPAGASVSSWRPTSQGNVRGRSLSPGSASSSRAGTQPVRSGGPWPPSLMPADPDLECVVVDDASTDGTAGLVQAAGALAIRGRARRAPENGGAVRRAQPRPPAGARRVAHVPRQRRPDAARAPRRAVPRRGGDRRPCRRRPADLVGRRRHLDHAAVRQARHPGAGRKSLVANPGLMFYASGTGKLFHRSIREGLRFEGRVLGDQPWTLRALLRAGDRIEVIGDVVYEWSRPRPGSECHLDHRAEAALGGTWPAEAVQVAIGALRDRLLPRPTSSCRTTLPGASSTPRTSTAWCAPTSRDPSAGRSTRRDPGTRRLFEALTAVHQSPPPAHRRALGRRLERGSDAAARPLAPAPGASRRRVPPPGPLDPARRSRASSTDSGRTLPLPAPLGDGRAGRRSGDGLGGVMAQLTAVAAGPFRWLRRRFRS